MTAMWQSCPVCNGSGVEPHPPRVDSSAAPRPCGVCKGQRIIGIIDGKPPLVATGERIDLGDGV